MSSAPPAPAAATSSATTALSLKRSRLSWTSWNLLLFQYDPRPDRMSVPRSYQDTASKRSDFFYKNAPPGASQVKFDSTTEKKKAQQKKKDEKLTKHNKHVFLNYVSACAIFSFRGQRSVPCVSRTRHRRIISCMNTTTHAFFSTFLNSATIPFTLAYDTRTMFSLALSSTFCLGPDDALPRFCVQI